MLGKDVIQSIDFGALYREQCRRSSFGARTSADWDRRAERRSQGEGDRDYSRAFLERVDLTDAKTALDIGCGTGNLAIPLAKRLRKVHALDFSPEMLRFLDINRKRAGVENIRAHRLSWTDSWKGVPAADVAVCSRAMSVEDLRGALEKMHRKARLRCYLTLHAGGSYLGPDVLALLDRKMEPRPDYVYAVNILYQMGVRAKVDFLRSRGGMGYASAEEFIGAVRWRVGELARKEEARLRKFFRALPREPDGNSRYRHDFEWAMLSWEKGPR
ncbi:MAG: class I SAM-dependent methyltransferase [Kiritimatiellia bacterium]